MMTSSVKVSIIVPVYNKEQYLRQCMDTIINQTLKEIEIILIDDGSIDNSAEICHEYLKDTRVIYYYKENEGLAAARQDGIERAHGEYIGFIDADDWIELNMFEKMYNIAKDNDVDVVFCNRLDNEDGHRVTPDIPSGLYNREQIISDVLSKTLAFIDEKGNKRAISWSNCRRIFKKQLLDDHSIAFDRRFRRSQDLMLTYEAMLYAQRFYHLGEDHFYHTRIVEDSLSRGYTKNMWPLYIPLIERLYSDTEKFPELDLMEQMHLRAFFSVTDAIDNEFKPTCKNNLKTKVEIIREIMEHPICNRFIGHIPTENLNDLLKHQYIYIQKKAPVKLVLYNKYYNFRVFVIEKILKAIVRKIVAGKVTGKIYRVIRGE